jgi:protein-tyrosine-phosphatase
MEYWLLNGAKCFQICRREGTQEALPKPAYAGRKSAENSFRAIRESCQVLLPMLYILTGKREVW